MRRFTGGELVPSAQNMDAVSNGTVECNHVLSTMYIGKSIGADVRYRPVVRSERAPAQRPDPITAGLQQLRELYKK